MVWGCDTFFNNCIYLSFILITSLGSESNAGLLDKSSYVTMEFIKLSASTQKKHILMVNKLKMKFLKTDSLHSWRDQQVSAVCFSLAELLEDQEQDPFWLCHTHKKKNHVALYHPKSTLCVLTVLPVTQTRKQNAILDINASTNKSLMTIVSPT